MPQVATAVVVSEDQYEKDLGECAKRSANAPFAVVVDWEETRHAYDPESAPAYLCDEVE